MSDQNRRTAAAESRPGRAPRSLPEHPVRIALLDLLAETGTLTSTEAAARLGHSSGLCSFHLRQLARHGLIEEVPDQGGRARPWRLRWGTPEQPGRAEPVECAALADEPADEGRPRRPASRGQAPDAWRQDLSVGAVLRLTPAEASELAASIRELIARYRDRGHGPAAGSGEAVVVAAVAQLFPLLPAEGSGAAGR
ncbi:ArsR/SmtB family transcription factor [Streptomyces huiliensis]|uniref:ArsR/SmtB family transcription factor n=1 Tax=Streptomyces huiliensis TaxID=2876027 RepID=UPI001CBCF32A|nr:helix-turn-helix domain-containing protein [Streptomyces huiliensis]MBZ4320437.1 helix-turn-helix domain-containing protein [Streptomyces huiliensis]